MHCTWFNEKKKKVNFPYIFLWVVFSPNTSPHLSPSPSLPAPHTTTWEGAPPPPRLPRSTSPGTLGPGPAGLQLLTSPGACAPQTHSAGSPTVLGRTGEAHGPGRDPLSIALSSDPV